MATGRHASVPLLPVKAAAPVVPCRLWKGVHRGKAGGSRPVPLVLFPECHGILCCRGLMGTQLLTPTDRKGFCSLLQRSPASTPQHAATHCLCVECGTRSSTAVGCMLLPLTAALSKLPFLQPHTHPSLAPAPPPAAAAAAAAALQVLYGDPWLLVCQPAMCQQRLELLQDTLGLDAQQVSWP
jgi:hypothetical protein